MRQDREAREAWDRNATTRFYELVDKNDTAYVELASWVLKAIAKHSDADGRVLDAGCGTGVLSGWMADHGYGVVGVDPSPNSIAQARKFTPHIEFACATLEKFTESNNEKFDVVVANMVLHTVSDLPEFIHAARRSLKKDGILVLAMPHPCFYLQSRADFDADSLVYSQEETYWLQFRINGGVQHPAKTPYIHRPLAHYDNALAAGGFSIIEREEPVQVGRGRANDVMFTLARAI